MRGRLSRALAALAMIGFCAPWAHAQDAAESETPTSGSAVEAPSEAPAAAPAEARPAPQRDATYELTLRELEDELNELKDDIFGSKTRLLQLRQQILNDPIGGSRVVLVLRDDAGARFDLVSVSIGLDGNQIFSATDATRDLDGIDDEQVFDGAMTPGLHNISIGLEYVGNGFGMFSYMNGYRVAVRASQQVMIEDGMTAEITIRGYEDASGGAAYEERPSIEFRTRTYETSEEGLTLTNGGEDL